MTSRIKYFSTVVCSIILSGSMATQVCAQEFTPFVAQANVNNVNVRAGQSANFERLCQLGKGEEVLVIDKEFSWYKIQLPLSAKSYVSKDYVQFLGKNAGGVTANRVNIRAGAGIHFTIVGQLSKGEQIYIQEEFESWYRIEPVSGSYGWIAEKYLELKSKDVSRFKIVPAERSFTEFLDLDEKGSVPEVSSAVLKQEDADEEQIKEEAAEIMIERISEDSPASNKVEKEVVAPIEVIQAEPVVEEKQEKVAIKKADKEKSAGSWYEEFFKKREDKTSADKVLDKDIEKETKIQALPVIKAKKSLKKQKPEVEIKAVKKKKIKKAHRRDVLKKKDKLSPKKEYLKLTPEKPIEQKRIKKDIEPIQKKEVIQEIQEPEGKSFISVVGYVEKFEDEGKDGIFYKIVSKGDILAYVQGTNHMLGRFVNQQVTVDGTVNHKLRRKYSQPVITVLKVRLML